MRGRSSRVSWGSTPDPTSARSWCRSGRPRPRSRRGFTLVELLCVIVVLSLLAALLLPAITGAISRAKEAAVSVELNLLATALQSFRDKHGELPPSRILLCEDGNYGQFLTPAMASDYRFATPSASDISTAQLAQRSVTYLRKFWPRLNLGTSSGAIYSAATGWPDFNGNGTQDGPYVLSGDECLVFFLGGVPRLIQTKDSSGNVIKTGWGMLGFGANPVNPFPSPTGSVDPLNVSRTKPFYEFKVTYLQDADGDGMPSYCDSHTGDHPICYFASYGGVYDGNDVNFDRATSSTKASAFLEADGDGTVSPPTLAFRVPYPTARANSGGSGYLAVSPPPNPYTTTPAFSGAGPVLWQNAQTFQLLASGKDGQYGVGGAYIPDLTDPLPAEQSMSAYNTADSSIRRREEDNITSFHASSLH